MPVNVSIAIPAFNEADALEFLLPLLARVDGIAEILVCDNGSTDRTAQVTQSLALIDRRIRLISEPRPGKPAAWNALITQATSEVLIFLDADAVPDAHAIPLLLAKIADSRHAIYAGRRRFVSGTRRLGNRAIAWLGNPVIELCLAGNLYAVRREPILRRLSDRGFKRMPDVFAEDIWLQSLFEAHEVLRVDTHVDIVVDTLSDYLELHARKRLVLRELRRSYPDLASNLEDEFPEALLPWPQLTAVLRQDYSRRRKLRWIAGAVLKSAVNTLYQRRIRHKAASLIVRLQLTAGSQVLRDLTEEKSLRALNAQRAGL